MQQETYRPIDIVALCKALWANKKIFLIGWPLTFVLACGIVLCIPRKYVSSTILAPEYDYISTENLRNIARSANVDIPIGPTTDAISPDLYPDVIKSSSFLSGILNGHVQTRDGVEVSVFDFYHQKNEEDWKTATRVQKHIQCSVDRKTGAITISCKAKDPNVAAAIANMVRDNLQQCITEYRTNKARKDVEFYMAQVAVKQELANNARLEYATYADSHQNSHLTQVQTEVERLESELTVRQAAYTAALVQLQTAEVRLQEQTPAFTIIQRAEVPVRPKSPKRMITVLAVMVLATLIMSLFAAKDVLF